MKPWETDSERGQEKEEILQERLKRHGQGGRRKTRRVRCPRTNMKGVFQEDRMPQMFQIRW